MLVDANARASALTEAACRRFDVLEPESRADSVLLYEIYDDRRAFETHLASDHYRRFDEESTDLCASKTVTLCGLVCEGSA
jgi:quinol monooxygenase YgiN